MNIKRIYRNSYKEVTTTTLDKIARALKVSVCDLIEELPEDTEKPEDDTK